MAAQLATSCYYVISSSPLETTCIMNIFERHSQNNAGSDMSQVAVGVSFEDVAVGSSEFESLPCARVR
jgi:hypothetical protein